MSGNKLLPSNSLVVVADGTGARLFRVDRKGANLTLKELAQLTPKDLGDDGPADARPPEQTAQQTDEATFAKQLANRLYRMAHAGEFENLALIADPQTLGQVRSSLHKEVADCVRLEIAKTLTNSPVSDIENQLQ